MRPSRCLLSVLVLAAATMAQSPLLTAHPQDLTLTNAGAVVPLGSWSNGSTFGEGHTMILVPKHELPCFPTLLLGIEVVGSTTSPLTYASLRMHVGPTTATSLQSTFALNHQVAPTQVLNATNLTVSYTGFSWTPIPFTQPYQHDGTSAMVIEIQKVVQYVGGMPIMMMTGSGLPPRTDRPDMIYAVGDTYSGASQAVSATVTSDAMSFRLRWANTPTLRHLSNVPYGTPQYALGSWVTLTLNGPPGHFYLMSAAPSFLPVAAPIPGVLGELRLDGPSTFSSGLLDANGAGTYQLIIPWNAALVGLYLAYQGATVDPVNLGIELTNGMDHFVNP